VNTVGIVRARRKSSPSSGGALALAVALAVALPVLAVGPVVGAETPVREARHLYEAGLQSYRAGNYDDAIAKLEASYRLVPVAGLLYDLAQAHRLKGDCAGARSFYRRFLDQVPTGPVEPLARSHLGEMERCVAAAAPAPAAPPVAPANLLAPTVVADHPSSPGPGSRRFGRRAAWATGITAVGLAATAGYFAWRADQQSEQVSGMFLPGQQWGAAGMEAQQAGRSSQTLGIVTAVGALLSGGIALWLAKRD
jgi:hypothetical protein